MNLLLVEKIFFVYTKKKFHVNKNRFDDNYKIEGVIQKYI